ncbi:MAG: hypothetical protein AAF685_02515 [Cyanobacteria bacterium P01_C01_bin.89]
MARTVHTDWTRRAIASLTLASLSPWLLVSCTVPDHDADLNPANSPSVSQSPDTQAYISACDAVTLHEGNLTADQVARSRVTQAADFQGDPLVATAVVVHEIERDQDVDNIAVRGQLQPVKQWPPNPTVTLPVEQVELLVCLEENRTAEPVENCRYETEGDRNTLITHDNDARAYLVEAKTLDLIDTYQFDKPAPSCPIDHQFEEKFRTEKLEGPALNDQEIQDWINRLD